MHAGTWRHAWLLLVTHGYFWAPTGTFLVCRCIFGHAQVLKAQAGTCGPLQVLLGSSGYFRVRSGSLGCAQVLLGVCGYFWVNAGNFGNTRHLNER